MPKAQQASLNHTLVGPPDAEDHDRAHALLELAIALVDSAIDLIEHHLTNDDAMTKESVLMPGGTLGKHFRHVIETYNAFLQPLRKPNAHLVINYDAILPETRRPIARSRTACRDALVGVRDGLHHWGERCDAEAEQHAGSGDNAGVGRGVAGETRRWGLADEFERQVELVAITPTRQEMKSSIGRELWFCSLHAIHHFSMLRTIAVHELLPVEFGTAPSTLLYRGKDWTPPSASLDVRAIREMLDDMSMAESRVSQGASAGQGDMTTAAAAMDGAAAAAEALDAELELVRSSLLPAETLEATDTWPRQVCLSSADSPYALRVTVGQRFPSREAVAIEVRGASIGRQEGEEWREWTQTKLAEEWDEQGGFPLYQLLTTHFVPLLAAPSRSPSPCPPPPQAASSSAGAVSHALFTSHHLLSTTKRRDFFALASQLSLAGMSKVGHPGIYYAVGAPDDIAAWVRDVKSWNWLALRLRVGPEPVDADPGELDGRGKDVGARGGKGRGAWVEVDKIADALEYMRQRGRQRLLLDLGIGGR